MSLKGESHMRTKIYILAVGVVLIAAVALSVPKPQASANTETKPAATPTKTARVEKTSPARKIVFIDSWDGVKLTRSDEEWKKVLSPMEFYVLRQQGTEKEYSGALTNNKRTGTYHCSACGLALFSSKHKYDSETGWPSFYQPIDKTHIGESEDRSIPAEPRTEVHCNRCGGHLGHVFDDGPEPTGLRYCINSAALRFKPAR